MFSKVTHEVNWFQVDLAGEIWYNWQFLYCTLLRLFLRKIVLFKKLLETSKQKKQCCAFQRWVCLRDDWAGNIHNGCSRTSLDDWRLQVLLLGCLKNKSNQNIQQDVWTQSPITSQPVASVGGGVILMRADICGGGGEIPRVVERGVTDQRSQRAWTTRSSNILLAPFSKAAK